MKQIVHITTMHPSSDTRIFRNECVSMVKAGYEVILCAPHPKEEIIDGVRIVPVLKPQSFIERIYKAPKKAAEIAAKLDADIYHFHDPELLFAMAAMAKRTGKKVIWDAHENYADTIYSFNSLKVKPISFIGARFFGWFELFYAKKRFKGVVTITDVMAEKYKKRGIPTAVVGNFSNTHQFNTPNFSRMQKDLVFISSGMQFKERGVVEIAEAFAQIDETSTCKLRYAGKIKSEELEHEIKSKIPENRIQNISFSGQIPWEQLVNQEIPSAEVGFVLFDTSDPNNCNGLPNRFFECWSNGIPVITTVGTQVARITKEENGGVIIPDNSPRSIAAAMKIFVENPAYARVLGENAFKAVQTKYSWEVAFGNLLGLYNKLIP